MTKYIILDSARKHGILDKDIIYALEHAYIKLNNFEDVAGKILYIGPNISATFLEVITVQVIDGQEKVIHAMKLIKKYVKN